MIATIHINNLKIETIIGTQEHERKSKQEIILNISMNYNAKKSVEHDEIKYAVDYQQINDNIIEAVTNTSFYLLETLCDKVLELIFLDELVIEATVRAEKVNCLQHADSVYIQMNRTKGSK